MTSNRRYLLLAGLISASIIAACSSNTATGPSSVSLARFFDSAYIADSSRGHGTDPHAIVEKYLALIADEGVTPVTVQVKTDGGTLPMLMMAAVSYDTTVTGVAADSVALVVGWTSDYNKYVILVTTAGNGLRVRRVPPAPVGLPILRRGGRITHGEAAIADLTPIGIILEGESVGVADSATGNLSSFGGTGRCVWQHVVVPPFAADSTIACSRVSVIVNFAFHFVLPAGVDPSLSHVSMSTNIIPGVRLVGFNGF